MTASTSLMVPKEHLARIAGANQTLQGLLSIFAPPLGALLIELFSTQNVLLIDVGTAMLAVLPLFFVPIPQPARHALQARGEIEQTSYLHDLREGFTYVVQWKGLLGVIILAMILNFLLVPASSFLPLVVTKVFNGGAAELGWVESVFGVGVIVGGILLSIAGLAGLAISAHADDQGFAFFGVLLMLFSIAMLFRLIALATAGEHQP